MVVADDEKRKRRGLGRRRSPLNDEAVSSKSKTAQARSTKERAARLPLQRCHDSCLTVFRLDIEVWM